MAADDDSLSDDPEPGERESFSFWEDLWWALTDEEFAGMTVYMIVAAGLVAAMLLTDSDTVTYVALAFGALGIGFGVFYALKAFRTLSEMTDEQREDMSRVLEEWNDEMGRSD